MKKVLIDGLLLRGAYSGVQHSIEQLVTHMDMALTPNIKISLLVPQHYKGALLQAQNIELIKVEDTILGKIGRVFFEHFLLPKYVRKQGIDLLHTPGYILPYSCSCKCITTVHDLIALDTPELCQNSTAIYFNTFLPASIRKANKIITVSETVKQDILRKFPRVHADKIKVIYPGIHPFYARRKDCSAVKEKYQLPDHYFLFVGNIEPKKNLSAVLKAFFQLKAKGKFSPRLVIAGQPAWKYRSILQLIADSPDRDEVIQIGYVADEDLPAIYTMADCLLFPSLYEGFGLPVIEAMACGCPVIYSTTGALPEISGKIGMAVNPYNITSIQDAMLQMQNDYHLKQSIISKGEIWSQQFTWQKAAEETLHLYTTVLQN